MLALPLMGNLAEYVSIFYLLSVGKQEKESIEEKVKIKFKVSKQNIFRSYSAFLDLGNVTTLISSELTLLGSF